MSDSQAWLHEAPRPASIIDRLGALLVVAIEHRAVVRVKNPLVLSGGAVVRPDIAIVPPGHYDDAHPRKAWLVAHVTETFDDKERDENSPVYARAGIDEYWALCPEKFELDVFRLPHEGHYREVLTYGRGDVVHVGALPDLALPLGRIFP